VHLAVSTRPGRNRLPRPIVSAAASHPSATATAVLDAAEGGWGELLLVNFPRIVRCEVALLCERRRKGEPQIVAVWGIDGATGITPALRGARATGQARGQFRRSGAHR
jgi:hypothetical protein